MSFDDRFELGELLRDDGIRTFAAREKADGQQCLAHFFADPAEAAALEASLNRLPERDRQRITDRGERAGVPYVVTGRLAGYPGFREWLKATARELPSLDVAGAWKVIVPERSVDEQFLNLFDSGERPQSPASSVEAAAPRVQAQDAPGEFTKMFQARPAEVSPQAPPVSPAPAAGLPQPGEFTRMFQANPRTDPKKPDAPGEFTRFFEAQSPQEPRGAVPAMPPPMQPNVGAREGEFTRVFGPGDRRGLPATSPEPSAGRASDPLPESRSPRPSAQQPAQATRVFDSTRPIAPQPDSSAQAPGEYTVRFSAPAPLTLGQPAEMPAPSAPPLQAASQTASQTAGKQGLPAGSSARWPLLLGIAAVVVLLVAVVLFVTSRSK